MAASQETVLGSHVSPSLSFFSLERERKKEKVGRVPRTVVRTLPSPMVVIKGEPGSYDMQLNLDPPLEGRDNC